LTNPDSEDEIRQEAIKIYQAILTDPEASVAMIASIPTEAAGQDSEVPEKPRPADTYRGRMTFVWRKPSAEQRDAPGSSLLSCHLEEPGDAGEFLITANLEGISLV
jgi:hypothetical protein